MKCPNCQNEYEGNFCPICGTSNAQPNSNITPVTTEKKKKKPVYKRWWFWLIIVLAVFLIIGICSGNNSSTQTNSNVDYSVDTDDGANSSVDNETKKGNAQEISVGNKVTIKDTCEFTVDYVKISADVLPPNPDSFYSHYEAENGKKYVDICIGYKNLCDRAVGADKVGGATLSYANKYQYTGFSIIEKENRSDFTYSNITSIDPLNTEYIHYLIEIPKDAADSSESLVGTLTIQSKSFTIKVR